MKARFKQSRRAKDCAASPSDPLPHDSLDRTLAAAGIPLFALELREVPKDGSVAQWFSHPHPSRSIGAVYGDSLAPSVWATTPANDEFDVLLFVEKTTAARPINQGER
jgi:erythromycin esterase